MVGANYSWKQANIQIGIFGIVLNDTGLTFIINVICHKKENLRNIYKYLTDPV